MGKRYVGLIVAIGLLLGSVTSAALGAPGQLDTTFSGDGRALVNLGGQDGGDDMAATPDGGYVVVGYTYATDDAVVIKMNADGSQDTSFNGGTGAFKSKFGLVRGYAEGVAVRPDGRIVVAGEAQHTYPTPRDFRLLQLTPSGSPDPTFTPKTIQLPDDANLADMALLPDGKIVLVGSNFGADDDVFVIRTNADGTPDNSFSGDGKMTFGIPTIDEDAWGAAVQADGKIVITGSSELTHSMFVARVSADGTVDSGFGSGGFTFLNFGGVSTGQDVAIQPDGKIVAVGYHAANDMSPADSFTVARLEPSGAPDLTFAGDGLLTTDFGGGTSTFADAVALQPNGKIVVGGTGGPGKDFALLRLDSAGNPDSSFGTNGKLTIEFGGSDQINHGLLVQADGKIVAAGNGSQIDDIAIARIEGDPPAAPPGPSAKCNGQTATVVGTEKRDVLKGTKRRDVIAGLGGNDKILGFAGNDLICGGAGKDSIYGGKGRDVLVGQAGADKLLGGPGKDKLQGGPGKDRQHQ